MSRGWIIGTIAGVLIAALIVLYSLGLLGNAAVPDSHAVEGTVVNQDGSVMSACAITVVAIRGRPVGETAQIADRSGHFSWPLPDGEYRITATCDDATVETTVDVPNESTELRIVVN